MQPHDHTGKRFYFTQAERFAFLEAAGKAVRPVRTLCLVLHTTGCRVSEALALPPARIDLECQSAWNRDPGLECAPGAGQEQAAVLTVCRVWWSSNGAGLR